MRCLITGGLGFIGSHLTRKLVENGNEVSVIDDLSSGAANVENLGSIKTQVKITIDTITNYDVVRKLASDVDVIFHLATQCLVKGMDDPMLMHQVNDIGTFNICMATKESKAKIVLIHHMD